MTQIIILQSQMYDLSVDLNDPDYHTLELEVSDSIDYVSLINQSIVFNPQGVVPTADGFLKEKVSLYLKDSITS